MIQRLPTHGGHFRLRHVAVLALPLMLGCPGSKFSSATKCKKKSAVLKQISAATPAKIGLQSAFPHDPKVQSQQNLAGSNKATLQAEAPRFSGR